jgi:hypothetical protein
MAASDYVPTFFKNRLHLVGRPQMSTRASADPAAVAYAVTEPLWAWQATPSPRRYAQALVRRRRWLSRCRHSRCSGRSGR